MSNQDNLIKQHVEMVAIVTSISPLLDAAKLAEDASEVRSLLTQLFGKLNSHLTAEDKVLYPRLLQSEDAVIKSTAEKFMKEMGGIGEALKGYKAKWPNPQSIQNDAATFITETKGIFTALANRIEKENSDLYPLLDT